MECQHNQEYPVSRWSPGFAVIHGQRFSRLSYIKVDRPKGIMVWAGRNATMRRRAATETRPQPEVVSMRAEVLLHAPRVRSGRGVHIRRHGARSKYNGAKWWPGRELNPRHADFQSAALPTELPGHLGRCVLDRGERRPSTNKRKIKKLHGIFAAFQAHFARNSAIFGGLDTRPLAAGSLARACSGPDHAAICHIVERGAPEL